MTTEVRTKIVSTVVAAAVIAVGGFSWNWAATNIVFAGDLEGLAEMIGLTLQEEIAPLAAAVRETNALAKQNAEDIRIGHIGATRAEIRSLSVEVQQMESLRQTDSAAWTNTDELLLREWQEDLEDLQVTLRRLEDE